jgi:hypothetical protein
MDLRQSRVKPRVDEVRPRAPAVRTASSSENADFAFAAHPRCE